MFIDSLVLEPVHGGPYHGAVAFHLYLGKSNAKELKPVDVISALEQNVREFSLKQAMLVIIDADVSENDEEVMQLVSTAVDRGAFVIGRGSGERKPAWFSLCGALRVTRRNPGKWLGFTVSELATTTVEASPQVSANNAKANKLLFVDKKAKVQDIFQFLSENDYPWSVVYPSVKPFSVELL